MSDKEPAIQSSEVYGYFQWLLDHHLPVQFICGEGVEVDGTVDALEMARHRLVLHLPELASLPVSVRDTVQVAFAAHGHRWVGDSKVLLKSDKCKLAMELPNRLSVHNRRAAVRVPLLESEQAKAVLYLTSRDASGRSGPALFGALMDLSTGGFCFFLERALDLGTKMRIAPEDLMLCKEQTIESLEILGVRDEPIEAAGILRGLDQGPDGLILRVQFRALLRADRHYLEQWSKKCQGAEHPFYQVPPPLHGQGEEDRIALDRRSALLRLKKKLRTILVAQPAMNERDELVEFLAHEGYGRVLVADTLLEVQKLFQGGAIHAVLVEGGLEEASGEELIHCLQDAMVERHSPILSLVDSHEPRSESEWKHMGVEGILRRPFSLPELGRFLEKWLELEEGARQPVSSALKGFKCVGILMEPGKRREARMAQLQAHGFNDLAPMGSLTELALALEKAPQDVLLLDVAGEESQILATLNFVYKLRPGHPWRMVVVAESPTESLVMACKRLGGISVVANPFDEKRLLDALLSQLATG